MAKSSSALGTPEAAARTSLTTRILAVNIFALAMLAGGFFYLDSYRAQLIDARLEETATQVRLIAEAYAVTPPAGRPQLLSKFGLLTDTRLRVYAYPSPTARAAEVPRSFDSWSVSGPTYQLRDPAQEEWQKRVARFLDRSIDIIVDADHPEHFHEPDHDTLAAWPIALRATRDRNIATSVERAPDRTPMILAAIDVRRPDGSGAVILSTENQRDITRIVRAERLRLGVVLLIVVLVSVSLSLFLARTIVRPLRRLALAAHRVRLGRAREVQVPRLPERRDEIGTLARALSDMSMAIRQRIDATEAFAADVTHELKNPLASLRSAVDSLGIVKDPALQKQLIDVIRDDVGRLDRLITDIAEASRVDAELARARFESVDLGTMIEGLLTTREERGRNGDVRVAFARPHRGTAVVFGDGSRLTRVIENLVENAVSFSPAGGLVQVAATRDGDDVVIRVEDEGPGVPPDAREAIFNRFHSDRPEGEEFGRHSGLGLAIAKAIVEGHNGSIVATDRDNAPNGARFVIRLPAWSR
ncbi:HAMP domain-containing protein [Sphingomonas histidinilytica]|uniref:histidine kinase n=1 Tax=Rhizorhabdus histidinilytica TaxID=439228 RepID=A0A1T5F2C6_9SPHN|nr:ATP-binding protein [Rhizorhabdus histidinilytica]MBO9377255.1 HAMP domain-containing protein [Rhizorhabdus histidinilytica]QEH78106.1 HAMP domain-containing protein [Sphingomonas sp. C8-2]SKB90266.1 two-component system, OmpR family, sensor histidine kinase ChvG [Rhizorhabdus histidinilytica]